MFLIVSRYFCILKDRQSKIVNPPGDLINKSEELSSLKRTFQVLGGRCSKFKLILPNQMLKKFY